MYSKYLLKSGESITLNIKRQISLLKYKVVKYMNKGINLLYLFNLLIILYILFKITL